MASSKHGGLSDCAVCGDDDIEGALVALLPVEDDMKLEVQVPFCSRECQEELAADKPLYIADAIHDSLYKVEP